MLKKCPKCLKNFECKSDNIEKCDCSKIILPVEIKKYIIDNYTDCLCLDCLKDMKCNYLSSEIK